MLKQIYLLLFVSFFITNNFAQKQGDIGVTFSSNSLSRYGVDYRLPLGEKYRLKFELNKGRYDAGGTVEVFSSTDSLVINRIIRTTEHQWSFYAGADRRIKESVFSLGLDLGFSFMRKETNIVSRPTILNTDGKWEQASFHQNGIDQTPFFNHPVIIGDDNFAYSQDWYFVPSIRASLNMDFPIGKSFIFKARGVFGIQGQIYTKNSNPFPTSDPLNEFSEINHRDLYTFQKSVSIGMSYIVSGRRI